MELRPYQRDCVDAIWKAVDEGEKLMIVVMATGLGKSVILADIPKVIKGRGGKTLIVAHREELLNQIKEKIELISPELKIGVEQAEKTAPPYSDVILASVATIGRKDSKRLKKFNPNEIQCILLDESHRSVSDGFSNVLSYFGCNKKEGIKPDCPFVVGFTATPFRGDSVGLEKVFNKVVYTYDINTGIENGYLSDIRAYSIFTNHKLNVGVRAGDFAINELSESVNNPIRNKLVVDSYKEICGGEKAICFTVDVQHTFDLCNQFRSSGFLAHPAHGGMPKDERHDVVDRFRNGDIQVLLNCSMYCEGFDAPETRAILMARPTKSKTLWQQCIGRGTRITPTKNEMKLLDFVDSCKRHRLVTSSSLIGLDEPLRAKGQRIMKMKDKIDELRNRHPNKDLSKIDLENIDKEIEEINIFEMATLPPIIMENSKYKWVQYLDGYKIFLGDNENGEKRYCEIRPNIVGTYEIHIYTMVKNPKERIEMDGLYRKNDSKLVGSAPTDIDAIKMADSFIEQNMASSKNLISQDARWNNDVATPKQVRFLTRNGHNKQDAEMLTKGQASNLISNIINSFKG